MMDEDKEPSRSFITRSLKDGDLCGRGGAECEECEDVVRSRRSFINRGREQENVEEEEEDGELKE